MKTTLLLLAFLTQHQPALMGYTVHTRPDRPTALHRVPLAYPKGYGSAPIVVGDKQFHRSGSQYLQIAVKVREPQTGEPAPSEGVIRPGFAKWENKPLEPKGSV